MKLTAYTDYSLRVLMYLGLRGEKLATISEISKTYELSENHLMKIIHNLGKLGHIETVRGRGGGMRLACEPEEINLGQLVRQTEPDFAVVECLDRDHEQDCTIASSCRLQLVFDKAVRAFLSVLDDHTLADLLQNRTRLRSLLNIEMKETRPN